MWLFLWMPSISVCETAFPVRKFEAGKMKSAVFSSLVGSDFDRGGQHGVRVPLLAQKGLYLVWQPKYWLEVVNSLRPPQRLPRHSAYQGAGTTMKRNLPPLPLLPPRPLDLNPVHWAAPPSRQIEVPSPQMHLRLE